MPEMIERVKTGLAENRDTKIDQAGTRVIGDENIIFSLQVAVCYATFMNGFDGRQHLCKENTVIADGGVTQGFRFDIFEYQVTPHEKAIAVGNAAYSRQAPIDNVFALQHAAIQPCNDAGAGG